VDGESIATHVCSKGRVIGRCARCVPLCLVTSLVICVIGLGPRWSCGSHPDEPAVAASRSDAHASASGTRGGQELKQSKPPAPRAHTRLALASEDTKGERLEPMDAPEPVTSTRSIEGSPIARALEMIAECQLRYRAVTDYTCTFYKRERVDGRLTGLHVMTMKVRRDPRSIYVKFQQPSSGREAIYVAGRHGGKLLAHDVGLNKLLAGTLLLDPTSARAMEDNRHPITHAGIGPLLDTLSSRWALELDPEEAKVTFRDDALVGQQQCTMVEVAHPHRRHHFLHHKVRVYIGKDVRLPIRFEAYDWPKNHEAAAELTEEYTYLKLRLNVGLSDIDFDTANPDYSFGRF
jgi:hypothetical protein